MVRGHFGPLADLSTTQVETLSLTANTTGWIEASFDCYGYGNGYRGREPQPWIWSANTRQQLEDVSIESTLDLHDYYGWFKMFLPEPRDKSRNIPLID
jgi:hypothetical protein